MAKYKVAYPGCQWCGGDGCLACQQESEKDFEAAQEPIFTAQTDNPEDMAALEKVFGREALEAAYAPGGGGTQEIKRNAAVESVLQILRKKEKDGK